MPTRSANLRYPLVVFDFDGTIVDSAGCISMSLERALEECGCACDLANLKDLIGLPLTTIVRHSSPSVDGNVVDVVIDAYRRHYADLEEDTIALFPGARDTLVALDESGIQLAIATNKFARRVQMTLERFGLASLFGAIVGADQVEHPKPDPAILNRVLRATGREPTAALMVGDTVWDLEMATRAGVASCAVTWGNQTSERLAAAQPTHVIDTFPALLTIVQTVVG